jgi:AmmeMemoRadiSam system protein B
MLTIQPPSVAGLFYSADREELRADVAALLGAESAHGRAPKALIAPHAGYVYSGPVAASAYAQLEPVAARIRRVVLLAPAHRLPFHGVATSSSSSFRTPLGDIKVDEPARALALTLPQVSAIDQAFSGEHAVEVQLPFLQAMLQDFNLVPFVVGDATGAEVAELLELLWGDDATLIVVSSDLSHYLSYEEAQRRDQQTTRAIEELAAERINYEDACGRTPVQGLLLAAKRHGLGVETVDLRNSGDTAGAKDRVVGYGAYVLR